MAGEREVQTGISGDLRVLNPVDGSWIHRILNLPKQYHLLGPDVQTQTFWGTLQIQPLQTLIIQSSHQSLVLMMPKMTHKKSSSNMIGSL